jgi:hypothetical protein
MGMKTMNMLPTKEDVMENEARRMKMVRNITIVCLCLGMVLSACGGYDNGGPAEFGWMVGGCAGQDQALVEQTEGYTEECDPDPLLPEEMDYCTEKLFWEYDAQNQVLQLVDGPVSLNCCGLRYVRSEITEGDYTLIEMDEPGDGRCRCMCDSIYSVCIHGLAEGQVPIRLYRHVTDDATTEPTLIWEGQLDLTEGGGQIDLGPSDSWNCI